jgi:hypothetical protein
LRDNSNSSIQIYQKGCPALRTRCTFHSVLSDPGMADQSPIERAYWQQWYQGQHQ